MKRYIPISQRAIFYVYEHWRLDKNVCFYVGKGKGRRAFRFKRQHNNQYYNRIVAKLTKLGIDVEVKLVANGLTEAAAFLLEIERIAFWRDLGIKLANITSGGQGASGRFGPKHSAQSKELLRQARIKQLLDPEMTAYWTSAHKKAMERPEVKEHMSAAKKAAFAAGKPNNFAGKKHSDETKLHWSVIRKGRKHSEKTKQLIKERCLNDPIVYAKICAGAKKGGQVVKALVEARKLCSMINY